jgi:hypothetical protein
MMHKPREPLRITARKAFTENLHLKIIIRAPAFSRAG